MRVLRNLKQEEEIILTANSGKSEFLANMSHEIFTLTLLRSFDSMVDREWGDIRRLVHGSPPEWVVGDSSRLR